MGAKLREVLVQAAHLIADAIEAEREPKKKAPAMKTRCQTRVQRPPPDRPMSEVDIARARQAARRAGIPIP